VVPSVGDAFSGLGDTGFLDRVNFVVCLLSACSGLAICIRKLRWLAQVCFVCDGRWV